MAKKTKQSPMPVKGGLRRNRNKQPTMTAANNDATMLRYRAMGITISCDATGAISTGRLYIPGYASGLSNTIGPIIAANYSEGRFMPGTSIRWEPTCSFNTSGRVYVAFCDNPEVVTNLLALSQAGQITAVKGMGSVQSFPVWQETSINFPTRIRRKMFDVNSTVTASPDTLDRCMQTYMAIVIDGGPVAITALGGFIYSDVLSVEGINPIAT